MKGQGLPINFIVIAALAILILILAAGFVVAGGSSFGAAVSPASARANCQTICANLQNDAKQVDSATGLESTGGFCVEQDIQGMGDNIKCPSLGEECYVTFSDFVQQRIECP